MLNRIVFSKQADHDQEMFEFWYYWYTRVFRANRIFITPVKTRSSETHLTKAFYGAKPGVIVDEIELPRWNPKRVWNEQLRIVSKHSFGSPFLAVSADADQFFEYVSDLPTAVDRCRFRQVYVGLDRPPDKAEIASIHAVVSEEDEWAGFVDSFKSPGIGMTGHSLDQRGPRPRHVMFHCLLHGFDHFRTKVESLDLEPNRKFSTHWRSWIHAYREHGEEGLRRVYDDMFRRAELNSADAGLLERFIRPVRDCAATDREIEGRIEELVGHSNFQMTGEEYSHVASRILAKCGCRLLVFGLGLDSELWLDCNEGGTTVFVEDQTKWIKRFNKAHPEVRVVHAEPAGRQADWRQRLDFPAATNMLALPDDIAKSRWDLILVDGPAGFSDRCPGRVGSICFAAHHAHRHPGTEVLVHDCDRELEATCCQHYFSREELHTIVGRLAHFIATGH